MIRPVDLARTALLLLLLTGAQAKTAMSLIVTAALQNIPTATQTGETRIEVTVPVPEKRKI